MDTSVASTVAFVAAGANAVALSMLLLFNPRNRMARWFGVWTAVWCVALVFQGLALQPDAPAFWAELRNRALFMLPAVFIGMSLVISRGRPAWEVLSVIGGWAALMALLGHRLDSWSLGVEVLMYGAWLVGIALIWSCSTHVVFRGKGRRLARRLLTIALVLFAPVALVAGLIGRRSYLLYVAPFTTVVVIFLIFIGVVHFQFYEHEKQEARRGEIAASAAEAERLAVLGELAATVAHEVRNPLTGVRSLAQRLAEESIAAEKRRRYAGVILSEIRRVEEIVSGLLDLAKGSTENGERGAVPLAPLFEDLSLLLTGRAQKAHVTLHASANGIVAVASRQALAQALLNLVINAIAHAPRGGNVHVGAERHGGVVHISVSDDGPGVPEEERERIFEPFYSGGGGTGLGLAVVRRLARDQQWTVTLEDAPDGGAEFRLEVPAGSADLVQSDGSST